MRGFSSVNQKVQALRTHKHVRRLHRYSRHPFAVPVLTFLVLCIMSTGVALAVLHFRAPVNASRVVIISHDREQQIVPSREPTVGALLKQTGITLHDGDVVEPAVTTKIDQDQFRINIYRARPVQVVDNGTVSYTYSAATTPRSIAAQAGLQTYAEDKVVAEPVDNFVTSNAIGQQVAIERATPINVNLYGTQLQIRTQAKTVGDLLKEKKITLASDDQISPAANQPISAGQQVFITRNGTKLVTETQAIPMPVQRITDPTLAYGTSAVRQQGSAGQQVVTYQVNLQNNQETGRTVIQTVVTTQPVTQVVVEGTNLGGIKNDMAVAGIASSDYTYVDYIVQKESGWNPSAQNASSGAYGLCQALPGSKMASAGSDWATNPVTQLRWCDGYAKGRYGSWANAYQYWLSHKYW